MGLFPTLVILFAFVYAVYGCVLLYHWVRYGASMRIIIFSSGTYAVIGIYLTGMALSAALSL